MALDLNQFTIEPQAGDMVYAPNRPQLSVKVKEGEATALVPGRAVKIASTDRDMLKVTAAAVTDMPYGVVLRNERQAAFGANEVCAIARDGDIVWLPAEDAITVGAKLQFTTDATVAATATATNFYLGVALTPATAKGDLVQVEISCLRAMAVAAA